MVSPWLNYEASYIQVGGGGGGAGGGGVVK
jgi:hypothetical protein